MASASQVAEWPLYKGRQRSIKPRSVRCTESLPLGLEGKAAAVRKAFREATEGR